MRGLCAIALLAVCIDCGQAGAQVSGATDNELYAAYCIGAIRNAESEPGHPASDPKLEEQVHSAGVALRQQLLGRFSGYLAATGIFTDARRANAAISLYAAMTHGAADDQQAAATTSACERSLIGETNNRLWVSKYSSCVNLDPAVLREMRCVLPDNLPF